MAFELKSRPQILADSIAVILAESPLNDMNRGSTIYTILEAAATEDFNQYFQMLDIINNFSLDNTSGEDLDDRAVEFGLNGRILATKAFSTITITDTAFTKISTKIYAGLAGPVSGQSTIFVDSANGFSSSGLIFIGRGTNNLEAVAYSSITLGVNFDTINLSSPLANDHGTDESVILSQGGNRLIGAGTVVKVPASNFDTDILFSTNFDAILEDGEDTITDVEITAVIEGTDSNVPTNSIDEFDTPPFPTAAVFNPESITNGRDLETDQELRDRIKDTVQSLSRGTGKSIVTSVIGIVDPVENKRVVSANLIDTIDVTDIAELIIDDGTGFEPSFTGQGFEIVITEATGGEEFIQLDNFPLVKATVVTINEQPYQIENNQTLIVRVNQLEEEITFLDTDFRIPGSAQAQEVVTAINNRMNLIEARTTEDRKKIELKAVTNVNEILQVVGGTANALNVLNFPTEEVETLKLYKFDGQELTILEKDGTTAILENDNIGPYDFSAAPSFIDIQMDNEVIHSGVATDGGFETLEDTKLISRFTNAADLNGESLTFLSGINIGVTTVIIAYDPITGIISLTGSGLTSLAGNEYQIDDIERVNFSNASADDFLNPSSASVAEVIAVINKRLRGIARASTSDTKIQLVSKTENSASSAIKVHGGTANVILGFPTDVVIGANQDYILNRFNGQARLSIPLEPLEQITSGTKLSRGFLIGSSTQPFTLADGDTISISIDSASAQVVTFNTADFSDITSASAAEIIAVINTIITGGLAEVTSDNRVSVRTNTYSESNGKIEITNITGTGGNIGFVVGDVDTSIPPHAASVLSGNSGPYNLVEGDRLVVVLDDDSINKTFDIIMDLDGDVVGITASPDLSFTAQITALGQNFTNKFTTDDDLKDMKIIWKAAANAPNIGEERLIVSYDATTGIIVMNSILPSDITAGDTFVIIPVTTKNAVTYLANTSTSTISLGGEITLADASSKVQIATQTDGSSGQVRVTGGSANTLDSLLVQSGSGNDVFVENALWQIGMDVIVSDDNTSDLITTVTGVTPDDPEQGIFKITMADPVSAFTIDQNAKITRFNVLDFNTTPIEGVDAYKFFTGLLKRVQSTVDGLEADQAFSGVRAAGVQVEVKSPLTQQLLFEIDIVLNEGVTISNVIDDIKNAVSSYVNSTKVGEDIILNEIVERVMAISGIFDIAIITPAANVPIADREIARVSDNDIIIG